MTSKVGPKGQVVIPKRVRDRLGIKPGDRVVITDEGGDTAKLRRADTEGELWGSLGELGGDPLQELEAEHRREIEREERARGKPAA